MLAAQDLSEIQKKLEGALSMEKGNLDRLREKVRQLRSNRARLSSLLRRGSCGYRRRRKQLVAGTDERRDRSSGRF
jgi:uncharacterized protein YigA (DUF484 family)